MQESDDLGISGLSGYQVLGRGGFATVYSAQQAGFNRLVAVKVLDALDEAGLRRFAREQASMGSVHQHPNIVTPYSSGFTPRDGRPYLVMEHMAGGSLQQRLEREGPVPVAEAVHLILPIVDALGHAHRAGVLHHDLKPANILVSGSGVVKLSDFGIAAVLDSTATATVGYSLAYSPPETFDHQATADRRDERSDLYSLAATLFALIAGYAPFENRDNPSLGGLMARILTQPVPVAGIPALDGFFTVALAKDPAQRYQTAAQFGEALRAVEAAVSPVVPGSPYTPPSPQPQAGPYAEPPSSYPPAAPHPGSSSYAPPSSYGEPPGWYHATGDPVGTQRYWDGAVWQGGPQSVSGPGPADGYTGSAQPAAGWVPGHSYGVLELVPANSLRRLTARTIDFVILFVPVLLMLATGVGYLITGIVLVAAYEVLLVSMWGTVGRKALGISLVGPSGARADLGRAAARMVAMTGPWMVSGALLPGSSTAAGGVILLYFVYLLINLVLLFASSSHRVIWDRVAGTRVVRVPPR